MNNQEARYGKFALCREMLETPALVAGFDATAQADVAARIAQAGTLLMTGEGSSRIFPAKSALRWARQQGLDLLLHTEAGLQATEYDLSDWAVFGLSNSGRTAEVIGLFQKLSDAGNGNRFSLSASSGSPLEELAVQGFVLNCGKEDAVAATKSVVEQALFYRSLLEHCRGDSTLGGRLSELAAKIETSLTMTIPAELTDRIASAGTIYWSGWNDGVAEELTLKTNEITRSKSDFLEGTYAVHGIEEVMEESDVVLWVDPIEESEAKFQKVLGEGVGLSIIAISSRKTSFPTIQIPDAGDLSGFVQLAGGWNVLVEVGLKLGIDLDKPERARKVGNDIAG